MIRLGTPGNLEAIVSEKELPSTHVKCFEQPHANQVNGPGAPADFIKLFDGR